MAHQKVANTFRWQAGCACCGKTEEPETCLIFSDTGIGPAGEAPAEPWDNFAGTWRYLSEIPNIYIQADAGLVSLVTLINDTPYSHLAADVRISSFPSDARLIIKAIDATHFFYAHLTRTSDSPTSATLEVGKDGIAIETVDVDVEDDTWVNLIVCYSPELRLSAVLEGVLRVYTEPLADNGGDKMGIASASGGDFDDIYYQRHRQPGKWIICPECTSQMPCRIFYDGFTGVAGLDPLNWSELSGTWGTNFYAFTSDGSAQAICIPENTFTEGHYTETTVLASAEAGVTRSARLYVKHDGTNYMYGEISWDSLGACSCRVGDQTGALTFKNLPNFTLDRDTKMNLCWSDGQLRLYLRQETSEITFVENGIEHGLANNGGDRAGIGTGFNVTEVQFLYFDFQVHEDDSPWDHCPSCLRVIDCEICEDPPAQYLVELQGLLNDTCLSCNDFNTGYVVDFLDTSTVERWCRWRFTGPPPTFDILCGAGETMQVDFILTVFEDLATPGEWYITAGGEAIVGATNIGAWIKEIWRGVGPPPAIDCLFDQLQLDPNPIVGSVCDYLTNSKMQITAL